MQAKENDSDRYVCSSEAGRLSISSSGNDTCNANNWSASYKLNYPLLPRYIGFDETVLICLELTWAKRCWWPPWCVSLSMISCSTDWCPLELPVASVHGRNGICSRKRDISRNACNLTRNPAYPIEVTGLISLWCCCSAENEYSQTGLRWWVSTNYTCKGTQTQLVSHVMWCL